MRKLIGFDDDTFDKLTQLGRGRMATLQELADEAFADLLKHGRPIDLKTALRQSVEIEKRAIGAARAGSQRVPVKRLGRVLTSAERSGYPASRRRAARTYPTINGDDAADPKHHEQRAAH